MQELLDRMDLDVAQMKREQEARAKIAPLVRQVREAYYRFPNANRLHVSVKIYHQFLNYFSESRDVFGKELYFMGCPVRQMPRLDGFQWVREEFGPVIVPD